ncbi:MAG: type II toxin-antitoxin system HicB family antitoxin [Chloroflexi bacterium]|nr:type II toxin-antitoxin system HicB family antitoxin [Chloroflexota bacterium]
MRYAIVIEKAENNYSAYAPDVPGCIATGDTLDEVRQMMKEALEFHFEGMREDGEATPEPTTTVDYVEVNVPDPVEAAASCR